MIAVAEIDDSSRLPYLQRPLHGCRAPKRRQQAGVDVERAEAGDGQEGSRQVVAVRGGDAQVGRQVAGSAQEASL